MEVLYEAVFCRIRSVRVISSGAAVAPEAKTYGAVQINLHVGGFVGTASSYG
jgi:hypothetical protein